MEDKKGVLYIRGVSESKKEKLKKIAEKNNRSVNGEMLEAIDKLVEKYKKK